MVPECLSNMQLKTPAPSAEQNNLSQSLCTFPRKSLDLRPHSGLKPPKWPNHIFQKRSLLSGKAKPLTSSSCVVLRCPTSLFPEQTLNQLPFSGEIHPKLLQLAGQNGTPALPPGPPTTISPLRPHALPIVRGALQPPECSQPAPIATLQLPSCGAPSTNMAAPTLRCLSAPDQGPPQHAKDTPIPRWPQWVSGHRQSASLLWRELFRAQW